jgi:spore maturation protein CgeB
MFSQRNIFPTALFRCPLYEFEDIICQLDSVEVLAPRMDLSARRYSLAKRVAFHAPIALNPGISPITVTRPYDLFLAICGSPWDLLMVNAVSNWKDTCKTSICLLDELWVRQIPEFKNFVRVLQRFDIVVLYYSQTVKPLSERIERPCVFMPPGVDAILFSPYPDARKRVVDVYSIGRRGDATHQTLLRMVNENGLFYLHDSFSGDQAIHSREHRLLFANVAKRSRYFIVNPGLIDRPDRRGNQMEIGNRYFEGAAAGTIMLGEHPINEEFGKLFHWPDAVFHLPYNSGDVDKLIKDLDGQPDRHETMRRTNVAQALMRFDWAYRWDTLLKTATMEPTAELSERKERLNELAKSLS